MSKLFLTSDLHLGHLSMLLHANRPWLKEGDLKENSASLDAKDRWISQEIALKRLEEMNNALIRNWNSRVKPEDSVVVIGDFCFRNSPGGKDGMIHKFEYWRDQLNGQKVFIRGNHDDRNSVKTKISSCVIDFANEQFYLVHDPKFYDNRYSVNFVGHVHQNYKARVFTDTTATVGLKRTWAINVGVDVWDFAPVSMEELLYYASRLKSGKEKVE